MSDIKSVQMFVPVPAKGGRKSRKSKKSEEETHHEVKKVAPKPASTKKMPLIVSAKQKGGEPLPVLSTTRVVGGQTTAMQAKAPQAKAPLSIGIVKHTNDLPYEKSKEATPPKKLVVAKKGPAAVTRKAAEPQKLQIQPKSRPNKTLKKHYSAKRITIHMENPAKVRKTRDAVRRNVANMPLCDVTNKLRERGLVRESANPPEHIQRLMMIDIELFPSPI